MPVASEEAEVLSTRVLPTMPKPTTNPRGRATAKTAALPAERLVLTGFMGSGKSTIGGLLAKQLGWHFLDLDRLIEERTGQTVPQLFADRGEQGFRKEETFALAAALRRSHAVIALGGGAPETLGNRLLLEQTPATAVVYLAAPLPTLLARCERQSKDASHAVRPLLTELDRAEARFRLRQPMYMRLAHHVAETEDETPEDIAAKVLDMIGLA